MSQVVYAVVITKSTTFDLNQSVVLNWSAYYPILCLNVHWYTFSVSLEWGIHGLAMSSHGFLWSEV